MSVRVRIGDSSFYIGPLQCPKCRRLDPTHTEGYGIVRLKCSGNRCRQSWDAIRLPPGTTGAQLIDIVGLEVARELVEHILASEHARIESLQLHDTDLARFPLTSQHFTGVPVYLQTEPDRAEPFMGWRRAAEILQAIYRESA